MALQETPFIFKGCRNWFPNHKCHIAHKHVLLCFVGVFLCNNLADLFDLGRFISLWAVALWGRERCRRGGGGMELYRYTGPICPMSSPAAEHDVAPWLDGSTMVLTIMLLLYWTVPQKLLSRDRIDFRATELLPFPSPHF